MQFSLFVVLVAAALFAVMSVAVDMPSLQKLDSALARQRKPSFASNVKSLTYQALANHFDGADTRTFPLRYWTDDSLIQKAPATGNRVLFASLLGEWTGSPSELQMQMAQYGASHNALLAAIEHRGYGSSPGFNIPISSSQALADFADVIVLLQRQYNISQTVVFGCSYAGNLAAWFRLKYPHIANAGAVASSAPVLAVADFGQYEDQVGISISEIFGPACDTAIRTAFTELDSILNMNNSVDVVNSKLQSLTRSSFLPFSNSSSFPKPDRSLLAASLMWQFSSAVQYGQFSSVNFSCSAILQNASNPLSSFLNLVGYSLRTDYQKFIQGFSTENSEVTWTWQTCTEFGYFQTSSNTNSPFSPGDWIPLDFYEQICRDVFGLTSNRTLEDRIDDTNTRYGGNFLPATALRNVVFQNSVTDPWARLSLQEPLNPSVPLIKYWGGHCASYEPSAATDDPTLVAARNQTASIIAGWLQASTAQPKKTVRL